MVDEAVPGSGHHQITPARKVISKDSAKNASGEHERFRTAVDLHCSANGKAWKHGVRVGWNN